LDPTDTDVTVVFSTAFNYVSKNLLVGIYGTKNGTNASVQFRLWSDDKSIYPAVYSKSTSASKSLTRWYWYPQLTFTYETPVSKTLSISPNEDAEFGEVYENSTKDYTITNNGASSVSVTPSVSGTNASSFSVSPSSVTAIAAGESETFTVTFNYASNSLEEKEATITFTPSDGEYNTIEIDASATAISNDNPQLTVTPDANSDGTPDDAAFGTKKADATKTYTVTNSGTGTMTVDIASDNATEFSVSEDQLVLGAGESDTFIVTFNFNAARSGNRGATITVTPTYDENDAVSISASATAITKPILSVSSTYVGIGSAMKTDGSREITVSNNGYGDMEVNISSNNETFFTVSPSTLTVAQDESETFTINFHYDPTSLGYKTATVTVASETATYDGVGSKNITTYATAIEPMFVSPTDEATDFGHVVANASRSYTITNLGTSEMDVAITCSNTTFFSLSETSFSDIPSGSSKTFTVTFNYDSEVTGSQKTTTITVTPNSKDSDKLTFTVKATPEADSYPTLSLDETSSSDTWTSGVYKNVLLKYNAKNGWNTFCVPFLMTDDYFKYVFGSGYKAFTFDAYNSSTHVLSFAPLKSFLSGGVPAIVYTESAPVYNSGNSGTVLYNRYMSSSTPGNQPKNGATFQGTYLPKAAPNMEGLYGVTTAGQVMVGTDKASLNGYRAYFTGVTPPPAGARISLVFKDDDEALGLSAAKWMSGSKDAYNLQGQRVEKGRKGIFIVNGRKVIIK